MLVDINYYMCVLCVCVCVCVQRTDDTERNWRRSNDGIITGNSRDIKHSF